MSSDRGIRGTNRFLLLELMAMPDDTHAEAAMRMAADIVITYLNQKALEPDQVVAFIRQVKAALLSDADGASPAQSSARSESGGEASAPSDAAAPGRPAVPPEESITRDYLISLEDGKPYRSLRRHLMAKHGLTPDDYRRKWNLPADYPMVAPSYAEERSEVAKRSGLGKPTTAATKAEITKINAKR